MTATIIPFPARQPDVAYRQGEPLHEIAQALLRRAECKGQPLTFGQALAAARVAFAKEIGPSPNAATVSSVCPKRVAKLSTLIEMSIDRDPGRWSSLSGYKAT